MSKTARFTILFLYKEKAATLDAIAARHDSPRILNFCAGTDLPLKIGADRFAC
jgi:hypothetical protein